MRIFSLHKSKSKKKISEKTPKLAAKKFLEKRKVGTVIYLHEHPSGKIHGPYQKEYDKKVMKGGLSVQHFRIDKPRNNQTQYPPLLHGTKQLIIKRPRVGFLSNEPRIFFGDNTKIDSESYNYYTYVCKNNDYVINNLISFRKLEDSIGLNPPQIRELTLNEVKEIPPQILLGFYTQYIDRCKEPFQRREIIFSLMYMRRLFFYLFYHILPVITLYILNTYVNNIQLQDQQHMSNLFNKIKKDNQEVQYFMNIINFLKRINQQQFIDEIKLICDLNQEQYDNLSSTISNNLKNFDKLSPQNEVNNIRQSITQSIRQSNAHNNIVGNMVISSARTGVGPMELVQFIGCLFSVPFRIISIFAFS
jgi:hypothetical protein